jgi:hypothetical protein
LPFLESGIERSCGAGIHASAAEFAVSLLQGFGPDPMHLMKIGIANEDALAAHFLTGSHASTAHNAEVIVSVKEGLSQDRHIAKRGLIPDLIQSHELHGMLKLALAVL